MGATVTSRREAARKVTEVSNKLAPPTIGEMIDSMHALREKKRSLEEQAKEIEGEYAAIETQLLEKLDTEKIDASKGKTASATVTTTVVANVLNWDDLFKYVKKTGYFHLFQRRVSDTAYRELLEQGKKVPGVQSFNKRRLNLRSL